MFSTEAVPPFDLQRLWCIESFLLLLLFARFLVRGLCIGNLLSEPPAFRTYPALMVVEFTDVELLSATPTTKLVHRPPPLLSTFEVKHSTCYRAGKTLAVLSSLRCRVYRTIDTHLVVAS